MVQIYFVVILIPNKLTVIDYNTSYMLRYPYTRYYVIGAIKCLLNIRKYSVFRTINYK